MDNSFDAEKYQQSQEKHNRALEFLEKQINRRELSLNTNNDVAMANKMIMYTASNLTLEELKLLRFIIMQTAKDDLELYEFSVPIQTLADTMSIEPTYLYKKIDTMTTHIMREVIKINDGKNYNKFHWVDVCSYHDGEVSIKLSDKLAPYLLNLRGSFTKYKLDEIINFRSVYAVRIYEVINSYMDAHNMPYADHAVEISVSIEDLRIATNTLTVYERGYDFKRKVIDVAIKDINRCSKYHVTATPYRRGRHLKGFDFLIESQVGFDHRQQLATRNDTIDDQIEGQISLSDYMTDNDD